MKYEYKINEIELNEGGSMVAMKGKRVKVVEVKDLDKEFLSHQFSSETRKIMFWSQKDIELDYMGG